MSREKIVKVKIYDQTYPLSNEGVDPAHIKRVAAYLDSKMREVSATATIPPLDVAVLAALNIAEEVLEERRKKDNLLTRTDQCLDTVTRRLEGESTSPTINLEEDAGQSAAPRF